MIDKLYSTHICYGEANFKYKDKSRWPEIRSLRGGIPFFVLNGIHELDDLLSIGFAKTYKKRIISLKEGSFTEAGSNGGGRVIYVRRLTKEDIELLYAHKELQDNLFELRDELRRLNPELTDKIKKTAAEILKSNKILSKNKLKN
jgi:hypothetical protein